MCLLYASKWRIDCSCICIIAIDGNVVGCSKGARNIAQEANNNDFKYFHMIFIGSISIVFKSKLSKTKPISIKSIRNAWLRLDFLFLHNTVCIFSFFSGHYGSPFT